MLIAALSLAFAEPVFYSATEGAELDVGGNWPKVYPDPAGGYHVLNATVGVYNYQHADDELVVDGSTRRVLTTDRSNLQDHGLVPCPDGTWLHVASATTIEHDDTAYAYLYDAGFNVLESATLVEGRVGQWWNDMPVVCGETFRGLGYYDAENNVDLIFVELDAELNIVQEVSLHGAPISLGASFLEEDGLLKVVGAPNKDEDGIIYAAFDSDYAPVERLEVAMMPAGWYPYWTQGFIRYGDHYLVGHLGQDLSETWETQGGDLWVEAFDLDWNHVDQLKLSDNVAPTGGLQPFVAVFGDALYAFYSKTQINYVFTVALAPIPVDTGDTGTPSPDDTGTPADDSGDTDPPDDSTPAADDSGSLEDPDTREPYTPGCGCASPGSAPALGALLLASALVVRRRR